MPDQPSRRAVLRLGGLALAGAVVVGPSGCTSPSAPDEPPPAPSPDEVARSGAARREQALAERADQTAVRHPGLTVATAAAAAHTAHAKALSETLAPSPSPTASTATVVVPTSRAAAARDLAAAETAAAEAHRASLAKAGVTGDVARLLASVAASDGAFALAVRTQAGAT